MLDEKRYEIRKGYWHQSSVLFVSTTNSIAIFTKARLKMTTQNTNENDPKPNQEQARQNDGWDKNVRISDMIADGMIFEEADLIASAMRAARIIITLTLDGYDEIKEMIFRLIKSDDMMLEHTLCLLFRMAVRIKAKGTKDNPSPITIPAIIDEYKARYAFNSKELRHAQPPDMITQFVLNLSINHDPFVLYPVAFAEVKRHVHFYVTSQIVALDYFKANLLRDGYDMAWVEDRHKMKVDLYKQLLPVESEQFKHQIAKTIQMMRATPTGVSTDLAELDKFLKLQKGCLYYIGGRPGVGKTALALHLLKLKDICRRKTIFISLEMSQDQLIARLLCSVSGIDYANIKDRSLDEAPIKVVEKIVDAAQRLEELNITLVDKGVNDIASAVSLCKNILDQQGELGMIVIDYLQLMKGSGQNKNQIREQEVSEISRSLKLLAKDCDCPVVCLTQVNREAEKRQDKRPGLSDLRESGSLEQDADAVLMLYRDDYYAKEFSIDAGQLEIIVAKNRHGSLGTAKVKYDRNTQTISDFDNF
jgi:replicative DNA helicase